MKKKALLVGINRYKDKPGWRLRGCVNDMIDMWNLLTETYGFHPDDIRTLVDDRATKKGILERLRKMVENASEDDILVYYQSCHGTQIRDRNGDELDDMLDEVLIPHDGGLIWDDPMTDDSVYEVIKENKARLYILFDCCHSGTMDRDIGLVSDEEETTIRYVPPPIDIFMRSYRRKLPVRDPLVSLKDWFWNAVGVNHEKKIEPNHVFFAACRPEQVSYEVTMQDGRPRGLFTYSLCNYARENPNISPQEVVLHCSANIKNLGYKQDPMVSGKTDILNKPLFGGKL